MGCLFRCSRRGGSGLVARTHWDRGGSPRTADRPGQSMTDRSRVGCLTVWLLLLERGYPIPALRAPRAPLRPASPVAGPREEADESRLFAQSPAHVAADPSAGLTGRY